MNDFLQMDIFFFVTTLAVCVVTLLTVLVILRVLRILKHVERLSETVSNEAELVRADIDDLRANVREEGLKTKHVAQFARAAIKRFIGRK